MAGFEKLGLGQLGQDANWENLNGLRDILSGKGSALSQLLGIGGVVATEPKKPEGADAPPTNTMMPVSQAPEIPPSVQPKVSIANAANPINYAIPAQPNITPQQIPQASVLDQFKIDHPELAAWGSDFRK